MGDDKATRSWVEDQLYALLGALPPPLPPPPPASLPPAACDASSAVLCTHPALSAHATGFAERALVDYCVSLGKKARDAGSLAATLEAQVRLLGSTAQLQVVDGSSGVSQQSLSASADAATAAAGPAAREHHPAVCCRPGQAGG